MVKHTQIILRQQPTNCLSVFDHFVGLMLKGLIWYPEATVLLNLIDGAICNYLAGGV